MILEHGKVFMRDKQQIVLLFDRVILSIDDKNNDEFVFATIQDKNINETVYFVCSLDSYNEAKKVHNKVLFAGFWHSLFINNKIDLSSEGDHHLITNELAYSLCYNDGDIDTSFTLVSEIGAEVVSNIDTKLNQFDALISPQDKIHAQRLKNNITIYSILVFWLLIGTGSYYYISHKESKHKDIKQEISAVKKRLSVLNHTIIIQKQDVYTIDASIQAKIKTLAFLRFKNIDLLGDVNTKKTINIKSSTHLEILQGFSKQYSQYQIKRHAEALPTLEVKL